jgi:hypothetical protein
MTAPAMNMTKALIHHMRLRQHENDRPKDKESLRAQHLYFKKEEK